MKNITKYILVSLLVVVSSIFAQVKVTEQYAGVIFNHSLSTENNFNTVNSISPRLGVNVRFPFWGYLYTRVVYDMPNKPFGHIIWEVPISENGWNGVSVVTGLLPRLASFIKPTPNSIDGHNETAAMAEGPSSTYALRLQVSDSVSEGVKNRVLIGVYRDKEHRLGYESALQLFMGETKVGLSEFFDSQVIGAAIRFEADIGNGYCILHTNKSWKLQDVALSLQLAQTFLADPFVDIIWNQELHKATVFSVGTFKNFEIYTEHKAQLGVLYDFPTKEVKVVVGFYW